VHKGCNKCIFWWISENGAIPGKEKTLFKPTYPFVLQQHTAERCKSARIYPLIVKDSVKNISITKYLLSCGFSPKREKTRESWFSSPLRPGDRDPSFKVDESLNLWYDFGSGTGGSIIDFAMAYHDYSFPQAITHLEGYGGLDFSFTGRPEPKEGTKIIRVGELRIKSLLEYLSHERKIELAIARLYLKEVHYLVNKNQYYAIGFKNDLGGYELRNPYFKSSTSPKYFTTITGKQDGLNLFEGFMDFLSALTYHNTPRLKNTTIILNSVSNISKLPDLSEIPMINLFLDNDRAGQEGVNKIRVMNSNIRDYSLELYPNHKDFNEMLTVSKQKNTNNEQQKT